MCGIFGVVAADGGCLPGDEALAAVGRDLSHRGPDAAGSTRVAGAAFAHTRLALIDLDERANQPMWDRSGRHCLLYNGEIYNYRRLRAELEAKGRRFNTESDTEVVLEGLLAEGADFLPRLEGMFALALYDTVERRLFLARDRLGIKPLVYVETGRVFCFASEVRPLRHVVDLEADGEAIAAYLAGEDPSTQGPTLFAGVRSLESGHWLAVDRDGRVTRDAFFTVPRFHHPELAAELAAELPAVLTRRLETLFERSVEKHLITDVEVGCLASGGLDSSLITAMAVRHNPGLILFHADVVGRKSERDAAERLARHFGLDLHTVPVDDEVFLSLIPETILRYEAPFSYHPNSVPFLAVAKLVREHGVKAILSGEGSDEAFLGYASARRRVLAERYPWLPGSRRVARGGAPGEGRLELLERRTDAQVIAAVAGDEAVDPLCLELLGFHLRTLLHRNDRLGMAASVEARFPFLDHDLLSFAANLGPEHKVRASWRHLLRNRHLVTVKWLVRKVGERHLPPDLAFRRKRGFPTTGLRRLKIAPSFFEAGWLADHLELSKTRLVAFVEEHEESLVRLLQLDLWGRLLLRHEDREAVQDQLRAHVGMTSE